MLKNTRAGFCLLSGFVVIIYESRNNGVNQQLCDKTAATDTTEQEGFMFDTGSTLFCQRFSRTGGGSLSLEASHPVGFNVCHGRRAVAFVPGGVVNYSGGGFSY